MIFHNVSLCSSNPSNIRRTYSILPRVAYWLKILVPRFTFREWPVTTWAWIFFPSIRVLFWWIPVVEMHVYMSLSWWTPTTWPLKSSMLPSICYPCIGCWYGGNNYLSFVNSMCFSYWVFTSSRFVRAIHDFWNWCFEVTLISPLCGLI